MNNFKFSVDVVLLVPSEDQPVKMVSGLEEACKEVSSSINCAKTKLITNRQIKACINRPSSSKCGRRYYVSGTDNLL